MGPTRQSRRNPDWGQFPPQQTKFPEGPKTMENTPNLKDTLAQFADQYRLRVKRDDCGDSIIAGKFGHLYEHGNGKFGLVLEDTASAPSRARALLNRLRIARAHGFTLHQAGDCESILLFDPADADQAHVAIDLVGAQRKRRSSPAQLAVLSRARRARQNRQKLCAEALPAA
jgi:hypothetical protein